MSSKYPQISFVYNRRGVAKASKKAAVEMRISYNYQQKYLSTGIMLYPNQWKNGKIVNCPDIIQISQTLDKMLSEVRQVILDMMNEGSIKIEEIASRMQKKEVESLGFKDYCRNRLEVRKYGKASGTHRRYACFINLFTKWEGMHSFSDVTDSGVIAFDKYLTEKGLAINTKWSDYHKFLKMLIEDAIADGYLRRNPYKWLSIEREHSNCIFKYLTPDEFRKLKVTRMPTTSLEQVRDVFVFQTYTCFGYSDLAAFDSRLVQEIKGMKVYIGNRQKTAVPFTIPILSPAWDILMKYGGKLPVISNVKYNLYLKKVASIAGINKLLSSHWARHTGATLLLNEGIDMRIVSKICGHSSTRITEQVYAKLLDETVVNAVQNLGDIIKPLSLTVSLGENQSND